MQLQGNTPICVFSLHEEQSGMMIFRHVLRSRERTSPIGMSGTVSVHPELPSDIPLGYALSPLPVTEEVRLFFI